MCPERRNPDFSEERIEQAILGNLEQIEAGRKPAFTPKPKPRPYRPHPKYTGFLALYYHYCYLLGRIEKRQYPPRMTPHLRKEIMKADIYKARLKFLQEQNICTPDDLTACIQNAEQQIAKLSKQRTILNVRKKKRKKLYDALAAEAAFGGFEPKKAEYDDAKEVLDTCGIPREVLLAEKADLYEQLAQVNQQIRQERWKLKQCKEISETAAIMQRDIDRVEQQPQRDSLTRTAAVRRVVPPCAVLHAARASAQVCATQTPRPPTVRRKKTRAGIKPALALQIERRR